MQNLNNRYLRHGEIIEYYRYYKRVIFIILALLKWMFVPLQFARLNKFNK